MYWLQKIGGERQLVTKLSLTVDDDGMIVTNLSDGLPSGLHVLAIPADNPSDWNTIITKFYLLYSLQISRLNSVKV